MNTTKSAILVILVIIAGFFLLNKKSTPLEEPQAKLPGGSAPAIEASKIQDIKWIWAMTVIKDKIMVPEKEGAFTLTLGADGQVSGTTDCNSFFSSYELGSDGVISFGNIGMTKMFCEGSQENEFVGEIPNMGKYTLDGNGNLMLIYPDETGLIMFKR